MKQASKQTNLKTHKPSTPPPRKQNSKKTYLLKDDASHWDNPIQPPLGKKRKTPTCLQ